MLIVFTWLNPDLLAKLPYQPTNIRERGLNLKNLFEIKSNIFPNYNKQYQIMNSVSTVYTAAKLRKISKHSLRLLLPLTFTSCCSLITIQTAVCECPSQNLFQWIIQLLTYHNNHTYLRLYSAVCAPDDGCK
jgi:hypothetical protein